MDRRLMVVAYECTLTMAPRSRHDCVLAILSLDAA
jgi:hypothetical protein